MKGKEKLLRNPYIRIFIVIFVVATILAIVVFTTIFFYRKLFPENKHFVLEKVIVKSSGYWNGRSKEIMKIIGLRKGKTNLYNLDLAKLKNDLTKHNEFSIESIDIYRVLPDILAFHITERIPRAILYNRRSELLVDENGILINRKYCVNINSNIPIITGFKIKDFNYNQDTEKNIPFGKELFQLKPALALISLVNTEYPTFRLKIINLYRDNELIAYMIGPDGRKIIRVIFPFKFSKDVPLTSNEYNNGVKILKNKLSELRQLFYYLRRKGRKCSVINLLYDDRAVVKK